MLFTAMEEQNRKDEAARLDRPVDPDRQRASRPPVGAEQEGADARRRGLLRRGGAQPGPGAQRVSIAQPDLDPLRPMLGFQNLSGNRLNRAPEYTINLGLTFTAPLGENSLTLRGEAFHSDDVFFRQFNQPQDAQEAYTTYNLFATLDLAGPISIRAFRRNITDEDVLIGVFSAGTIFDRWAIYAPPRTWGVELRADF